jgi:hypothetical protein
VAPAPSSSTRQMSGTRLNTDPLVTCVPSEGGWMFCGRAAAGNFSTKVASSGTSARCNTAPSLPSTSNSGSSASGCRDWAGRRDARGAPDPRGPTRSRDAGACWPRERPSRWGCGNRNPLPRIAASRYCAVTHWDLWFIFGGRARPSTRPREHRNWRHRRRRSVLAGADRATKRRSRPRRPRRRTIRRRSNPATHGRFSG